MSSRLGRSTHAVPRRHQAPIRRSDGLYRLGRSLKDLVAFLSELPALGIDLFLHHAGRKPGSRNRLSEAVICALLRDFSKHGEKAIAKVRRTRPAAYLKICALLVPRENKVEHSRLVSELSDQQLNAMIEALSARLEARAAGIDVPPLIDVTPDGEVMALPIDQPGKPAKTGKRPNPILDYQSVLDDPSYVKGKGKRLKRRLYSLSAWRASADRC